MGSNYRHKKSSSSFSVFSFFKSRRPRRGEDAWPEDSWSSAKKVWPSDEDKGRWVAEPGIDRKASAFIAKFHESRVMESERQTFAVCPNGKA